MKGSIADCYATPNRLPKLAFHHVLVTTIILIATSFDLRRVDAGRELARTVQFGVKTR